MHTLLRLSTIVAVIAAPSSRAAAQQHPAMPPGISHEAHLAQMQKDAGLKRRGAAAMGFEQDAAVHHFRLTASGGVVRVEAAAAGDDRTREAIRSHLRTIASAFAGGDFGAPLATHGEMPPGTAVLQRLGAAITYTFVETPRGGLVRIATADRDGIESIHAFLRYQITEHRTGDPLNVQ